MSSLDRRGSDFAAAPGVTAAKPGADSRTLVVLAGIVSSTIGCVYWILRAGFDNPAAPVIRSIALSLFLITFPLAARKTCVRFLRTSELWIASYPFLWLAGLGITALIGRIVPVIGFNPFNALALVGLLAFALIFVRWLGDQSILKAFAYVAGAAAFGVWTAGVVWGRIYKNPLYLESLITDGKVHHDTLNLSALGNMLRTYHAATTGIDGLSYVPYHWGSAWLFVQWANLVDIDVLRFYQLSFPVIVIPLFFGGVVALAIFLRNRRAATETRQSRLSGTFWAVLLAVSIGIAPLAGMEAMGVWTSNILISESYTIAIPMALFLAATVIAWTDDVKVEGNDLLSARLAPTDLIFLFVLYPAGIALLGYLKISLMALAFAGTCFLVFRLRLYRRTAYVAALVVCAVVFYLTYRQVSQPSHNDGLAPLDYIRLFVPPPWWVFFPIVHLLWTWVYTVFRLRSQHIYDLGELRFAIVSGRLIDVEFLVFIATVGVIPGLIIHIDGGSAFYFSDVQRWLACAMLLSWVASTGASIWPQRDVTGRRRVVGTIPTRALLVAFVSIVAIGSMISNAIDWPMAMLMRNVAVRQQLYARSGHGEVTGHVRDFLTLRDPAILANGLAASPNFSLVRELESIQQLPVASRRRLAVFIPQSDSSYWNILTRPKECSFQPFVVPALSGVVMIDGMPALGCTVTRYYGMGSFVPRRRAQAAADTSVQALCSKALAIGADSVIFMRFPAGVVVRHDIPCSTGKAGD